jgi:hypothetical protein
MSELVELSPAKRESLERSAIAIFENIPADQRSKIVNAMERTCLKLARKYEKVDSKGRAWAIAMATTLRALVAGIDDCQFIRRNEVSAE